MLQVVRENIDEEKERKQVLLKYRNLLRNSRFDYSEEEVRTIRKAFDIALEAHKGVRRKSGEPYIFHPLEVARIVTEEIGLGSVSVAAAILHDVVEDTDLTIKDIDSLFGHVIAGIIDGLTKIEHIFEQEGSIQAANFRKVILTLADDVRVILIKLADRLHNMRTLQSMPKEKQLKIASETLYIYAPLAHRLGLYALKSELEDLALKYKAPKVYNEIVAKLKQTKAARTRFINRFIEPLQASLNESGMNYEIYGRLKSIYSIWNKMRTKGIPFEEVFDVFAIRVIIETNEINEKADCWKVYSIVTDYYTPNPDRLRDWISTPKANGYESLHTTVMSPTGKWVEVQIRTNRMDEVAERGLAAHWRYKEKSSDALDNWINRVREVLESAVQNPVEFINDFKLNLFAKEIFVFTPKGEIKAMPHNSTVLDFAYEIHSELGFHCVGGKVSQKLVPLSHVLKSGDQVEIVTSKVQQPNAQWLNFVVTAKAKSAIKSHLRDEYKNIEQKGKQKLNKALRKYGITRNDENYHKLTQYFRALSTHDLFYKVGMDSVALGSLSRLKVEKGKVIYKPRKKTKLSVEQIVETMRGNNKALVVGRTPKVDYALATCCHPIPGDDVIGFLNRNNEMEIHRINCENTIPLLSNYSYKVVKAKWDSSETISFLAGIKLSGIDRRGIVKEMTTIISDDMHVNIRTINIMSSDGTFDGEITVYVNDTKHLMSLKDKLRAVKGVTKVHRLE